ncbi:MAG TPA: UbiX family flavin prenyltransferase [Cellulomonas sp.]
MRVVVGIAGASGAAVAVETLRQLAAAGAETHLVVSRWGAATLKHETGLSTRDLAGRVHALYRNEDLAAPISSGSFPVDATVVVPCSARSLGAIASGAGDTLLARAADVALKERRRLVLALRETPLSAIHLRNALEVTHAGAIVCPLTPVFYSLPTTVDEVVHDLAERVVSLCGIEQPAAMVWGQDLDLHSTPAWRDRAAAPGATGPTDRAPEDLAR